MEHINKDVDEDNEDVWCTVSNKCTPIKQIIVKLFLNSSFEHTLTCKWAVLNESFKVTTTSLQIVVLSVLFFVGYYITPLKCKICINTKHLLTSKIRNPKHVSLLPIFYYTCFYYQWKITVTSCSNKSTTADPHLYDLMYRKKQHKLKFITIYENCPTIIYLFDMSF